MIIFVITLSNVVSAHPGHGDYPEPVTSDDTSGSGSTGTTSSGSGSGSTDTTSSGSGSGSTDTTSSGSGSGSTGTTSSGSGSTGSNIGHISSSNQAENVDSGIEPVENESNETKNSTSTEPEDNSSWGNIALVGLLVTGLAVFGFLYKGGMLNR